MVEQALHEALAVVEKLPSIAMAWTLASVQVVICRCCTGEDEARAERG